MACIHVVADRVSDFMRKSLHVIFDGRVVYNDDKFDRRIIRDYSIKLYMTGNYESECKDEHRFLHVDYIHATPNMHEKQILNEVMAAKERFYSGGHRAASVVVFDLDDTIIDRYDALKSRKMKEQLYRFAEMFQYRVLWSHGNVMHVQRFRERIRRDLQFDFHFIINRDMKYPNTQNKGMGLVLKELNRRYGITEITQSCLVDDLEDNFVNDYTFFVHVPRNKSDLTNFYDQALDKLEYHRQRAFRNNCIRGRHRVVGDGYMG